MPLSKARNRERMRLEMRRVRALKRDDSTMLLPSSEVRRLRRQGLNITRALLRPQVTMEDYRDLERRLETKAARVEWQSGGIKMLRDQVATLEARLATLPAMEETELKAQLLLAQQRITLLEAAQVVTEVGAGEYSWEVREHTLREEP